MSTDKAILEAGFAKVATLDFIASKISWPGVDFDEPGEGLWLEVNHFPNQPGDFNWDSDGQQLYLGFFQVGVYWTRSSDKNPGYFAAVDQAELIIAHFTKATLLGGVRVSSRPYMSPMVTNGDTHSIPVTIPYRGIA